MERDRIRGLVAHQLTMIAEPARRSALASILTEPRAEEGEWDYGVPGQHHPYWVVAEDAGVVLVYCEHGFGPERPWGFLYTGEPEYTLGMDSQWTRSMEEAFIHSGLWSGSTETT